MLTQALALNPFPNSLTYFHRQNPLLFSPSGSLNVSRVNEAMSMRLSRGRNCRMTFSASKEQSSSVNVDKKRKVVEHICLLKAKNDLSEEEEKDMLDYLYTSQYQMGGIVAISLGRISNQNVEDHTHAVFMRFQRKEDLAKFYENPFYLRVLRDNVTPYCHVCPDMD